MNEGKSDWASGRVPNRLLYFLHWLVRVDPELMSGCPTIDRFQAISKAVLLCAVVGIAAFAWGAFFGLFWPFYIALPLTAVVIVWIAIIDQTMGAARWALQGILAVPGRGHAFGLSTAFGPAAGNRSRDVVGHVVQRHHGAQSCDDCRTGTKGPR
jgi:hypothetical protein